MILVRAHLGQDHPTARAFCAFRVGEDHRRAQNLRQPERLGWRLSDDGFRVRRDRDLREAYTLEDRGVDWFLDIKDGCGLEARPDDLVPARDFKRAGDNPPKRSNAFPFRDEGLVFPKLRGLWKV